MERLPIPQYVMALAHVAALRSEDPYRKVGAAALDKDNRVIGTAYNGLFPGFDAPEGFWASRDERQKFMLHAEINLCSLFKRGEAHIVACTTMPCTSCMQALCAHGVKKIYYGEDYAASQAPAIAAMYGVELVKVDDYPLSARFPLVAPQAADEPAADATAPDCPCCVETNSLSLEERARGCLLGLMCGDALGAPVEFHAPSDVCRLYPDGIPGMVDGWGPTKRRRSGAITDDSEMALALLRSLLNEQGLIPLAVQAQYIDWISTNPEDVGVTISMALEGSFNADSQANGALMRIAPVAIYAALHPEWDWRAAAEADCRITHIHPRCIHANIIYTESLLLALQGHSPQHIYDTACKRALEMDDMPLLSRLRAARDEEPEYYPQAGWVEIAFQCAYYWLLHAESYPTALCSVVNRCGDPDTNGAIAGALLGAVYGQSGIPRGWQNEVLCHHSERPSRYRATWGMELLEELFEQAR